MATTKTLIGNIKGPKGEQGPAGPRGAQGPAGPTGAKGDPFTGTINGMSFSGAIVRTNYSTCSTATATAAKTVACAGFSLTTGASITVKFTAANTAANPTLNVNSTGAKAIYRAGAPIPAKCLAANQIYEFRYNGTQYEATGEMEADVTWAEYNALTDAQKKNGVRYNVTGIPIGS